jgi:hypothetical protein
MTGELLPEASPAQSRRIQGIGETGTRVSVRALAALAVLIVTLAGCHHDRKLTPPPVSPCGEILPQSSPENVLALLKSAYQDRNLDAYTKLFTTDFFFVFPHHMASDTMPDRWGAADEFASAHNLFSDASVERIQLDLVPGVPQRADSLFFGPGAWRVIVDVVNLQVHMQNEAGEPWTYVVPDNFGFIVEYNSSPGPEPFPRRHRPPDSSGVAAEAVDQGPTSPAFSA